MELLLYQYAEREYQTFFFKVNTIQNTNKEREKKIGAKTCTSMVCSTTTYEGPLPDSFPFQSYLLPFGTRTSKHWQKNPTSSYFCMPKPHGLGISIPSTKATLHNKKDKTNKNCKPSSRRTKQIDDWTKMVTYVFKWRGTNKLVISHMG